MTSLSAICHCGAVRVEADHWPISVTSCNCSICRRYAALWAYYTRATARVTCMPSTMSAYRWGDGLLDFVHCKTCGCLTHYESVERAPDSRIAINARMLPADAIESLRVRRFDGASSWRYLD